MKDYALIAHAYDKQVRIYAAQTTQLVEHARKIHETWPTATAAFGRFLTISSMMGLMYKNDERITLRIKSDGPISSMLVEANAKGEVRGELNNSEVYIKYEDGPKKGKLNVGEAVGKGFIYVTKDLNMKDFFTSSSELQTGEIAEDFTYYFAISEQVPTSIGLGVLINTDQSVLASGGYLLQLMPGASDAVISKIESVIANIKPISTLINEGKTPEDIINLLSDGTYKILEKKDINYVCHCSKEGFSKSLCSLDAETMKDLIEEDEGAEIICHFCHEKYHFTKTELEALDISRKEK